MICKRCYVLSVLLLAALMLAGCDPASLPVVGEDGAPVSAGKYEAAPRTGQATPFVDQQYIVVFKDEVAAAGVRTLADQLAAAQGGQVLRTYRHALRGFAAALSDEAAQALKQHPDVAFVQPDQVVYALDAQPGATWGLDRIDQRNRPLDDSYTFEATGAGVRAFVIDTGIRTTHLDFGARASAGFDAVGDGRNGEDCHGHGTHVAGTLGSSTYGVAKGVSLVAVRVLNCSGFGSTSNVVAGIDYVAQQKQSNPATPMVANMSLGGGANPALDDAVRNAVAAGVTFAVAAGNSNTDACTFSPARVAEALTAGASTSDDARASYSNHGTCVDLFAPGSAITSTYYASDTATATFNGTSMASPHVAGVAALYLEQHPAAATTEVFDAVIAYATPGVLTGMRGGSPNLLLFSLFDAGEPPPNFPPQADFTHAANAQKVTFTDHSSDRDGAVVAWSWDFGDGKTSTHQHAMHLYGAEGTYSVTLTVTDDDGATGSKAMLVTVNGPIDPTIALSASRRGGRKVDLSWHGATSTLVDIHRNGARIATTDNDEAYTDKPTGKLKGTFTYQVCEAGTNVCSNESSVQF